MSPGNGNYFWSVTLDLAKIWSKSQKDSGDSFTDPPSIRDSDKRERVAESAETPCRDMS